MADSGTLGIPDACSITLPANAAAAAGNIILRRIRQNLKLFFHRHLLFLINLQALLLRNNKILHNIPR